MPDENTGHKAKSQKRNYYPDESPNAPGYEDDDDDEETEETGPEEEEEEEEGDGRNRSRAAEVVAVRETAA